MQRRQSRDPDSRHHRHNADAEDGRAPRAKHSPGEATAKDPWGVRKGSRFLRRGTRDAIDPNWAVNILDPSISRVFEKKTRMPAQLFADGRCDRYPAGFGQPFEPGSNIDAVAVNVIFLDDNIARIDADAQLQLGVAGGIIVGGQTALDIDGAIHRVDGAVELNEKSVALAADESTLVQRYSWFDHGFDAIGKPDVCALLVDAHQTAIADDIGEKDRGKLPFEVNAFHSSQLIFPAQSRHFPDCGYSGVKIEPPAVFGNGESLPVHGCARGDSKKPVDCAEALAYWYLTGRLRLMLARRCSCCGPEGIGKSPSGDQQN